MPDGLMTIGVFSRASSLSIKALRAYHEAGILEPQEVDPASGYRRYHAELFAGQEASCWEKHQMHQMEQEIARDHAYAA